MIVIKHRFIDRLLPNSTIKNIDVLIIGTFNPGMPNKELLDPIEKVEFSQIQSRPKFKKFSQVQNFYDRPQNRLWKIFDFVNEPSFYAKNSIKTKNTNGLKFYKGLVRDTVFIRQQEFCKNKNIFITDIVKEIQPKSFDKIYDNFPDTSIEKCATDFNTDGIIDTVKKHSPKHILLNFNPDSKSLPKLNRELERVKNNFPTLIRYVPSTSGAAANTYEDLVREWSQYFST